MFHSLTSSIVFGFIVVTTSALAAERIVAPPTGHVSVRNVSYAGSGCSFGSADASLSPNFDSLVVGLDDMYLSVPPLSSRNDLRKNCQFNIDLAIPAGYSYAIAGVSALYNAEIPTHSSVVLHARSYRSGSAATLSLASTIRGLKSEAVRFTAQVSDQSLQWSPCGSNRMLNLNLELRASDRSIVLEGPDHGVSWVFPVKWRRCAS